MPIDRFYLKTSYKEGSHVSLGDDELHHLSRVMRKKNHAIIELINGEGGFAKAKILKIEKKKATLLIIETTLHKPQLPPLTLVQALPKLSHLEMIIQKGTELGVTSFHLFPSERSEKKTLTEHQTKRLKQICIGAMKQCGRFDLPIISFHQELKTLSLSEGHAFFGDPCSIKFLPKGKHPYQLFIGPEKGFSESEHRSLETLFQAQGVCLHPYILRTETAAITALALATAQ